MNSDLQLDSLLQALRTAGLRVGISEVLRLRQVFANHPGAGTGEVSRERLKSLLRAVLVKSADDRGTFDRICDAWLDRAEEDLELRRVPPRPVPAPIAARRGTRWRLVVQQAAMAATLAVFLFTVDKDTRVPKSSPPDPIARPPLEPPGEEESPPAVTPDAVRKRTFRTSVATLEVTARPWLVLLRPETGLAVFAWLGAGGLWLALRRRRLLPEPEPLAPAEGPPRAFPLPVVSGKTVLLAPREQEGLAWGIGRFVSEEPTRRLDLAATVRATALAGGLPEMRFHRARFYREVWLWVDEDADDPALPRLAEEIETVLAAHGLPVERAVFRGIPDRLVTPAGQVFAPNEIDERRDVALVAVLTDGRRLVRRWAADDQRLRIDALLRSLSHWPHLAFVDASRDKEGLAAILGRHGLTVVAPENAAAFLGGRVVVQRTAHGQGEDDEVAWAAACALCPAPVDEATALELRRHLWLAGSPFALQALRAEAPGPPGRLTWRTPDRIRRVRWLCAAEVHRPGAVAPQSLLDRALRFWEDIYDRSLEKATGLAERSLQMERALLGLWRTPAGHVAELYRLFQGPLQEVIARHCETLAPADWAGAGLIPLPWPWSQPKPVERAMLRAMRFGGGMPPVGLLRPGRAWLGIGLLVGLGCAVAGMAVLGTWTGRKPEVKIVSEPPAGAMTEIVRSGEGRWLIVVATRKWGAFEENVENGSRVLVRWRSTHLPCVEPGPGGEIWRCGSSGAPISRLPGVSHSVVLLDRSLGTAPIERLTLDLLDSGSVDIVAVGDSPKLAFPSMILKDHQTLLLTNPYRSLSPAVTDRDVWLTADRLTGAEDRFQFDGLRPVREVFPEFQVVGGDASKVFLRGLGTGCRNTQIQEKGFTFVRICPDSFMMGSEQGDPQAYGDEKPAHRVTLDEFWMSKFEVTNAQYRKLHPDHEGDPNLPATNVSWFEARDFCKEFEYQLPTEAQWEYAARAGTETPWSSSSTEKGLKRFAWFDKNSGLEPHPVGQKDPNPWGLHDMHGNAWEWVADWDGPYSPDAQVNPRGPTGGTRRVVRGGSFADWARDLRSAIRNWGGPENRDGFIGFRCVRVPLRRP